MTHLLLVFSLLGVVSVQGACVDSDSPPCPPPFPDFATIFRETLNLIPEMKLTLQEMTSADNNNNNNNCPMAVNWTEFNSLLNYGNPIPLDPVCRQSTVSPGYSNPPASSKLSTSQFIRTDHQTSKGSTSETTTSPVAVVIPGAVGTADSKDATIGIAVGVIAGTLVITTVIVIIIAALRCSKRRKNEILQRGISTNSQTHLVTDESFQPITPGTCFPQDSLGEYMNSNSLRKGVITLRDSTCQESSTDATLPRMKDIEHGELEKVVMNEIESLEKVKTGFDNLTFETVNDEQDDAGYAGSEAGQELWENEMNVLFEGAKMESNEDINEAAQVPIEDIRRQDETGSDSVRDNEAHQYVMMQAANDRSRDSTDSSSDAKLSSLKLNLSPPSRPLASHLVQTTPTILPGSPFSILSSTKSRNSPQNSNSRHPLSQEIVSDQNSTRSTKSKVRFELDDSAEAPPAYSSPLPPSPASTKGSDFVHVEIPIDVPNELPSYSEVVFALDDYEQFPNEYRGLEVSSSSSSSSVAKQNRPSPKTMPKPKRTTDSEKSLDSSSQGRLTNTAVIKPLSFHLMPQQKK